MKNNFDLNIFKEFSDSFQNRDLTVQIVETFREQFFKRLEDLKNPKTRRLVFHDLKSTSLYVGASKINEIAETFLSNEIFNKKIEEDILKSFKEWEREVLQALDTL